MKVFHINLSLFIFLFTSFAYIKSAQSQVNVRVDPLRTLTGVPSVDVDFAVSSAWSLGPTFSYLNKTIDDFEATAYNLGIRGNYYFNGSVFTQGWYFGPSLSYLSVKVTDKNQVFGDLEGSASGLAFTALGGYQWMWDHFNINLGLGPVFYTLGDVTVKNSDNSYKEDFSGFSGAGIALEFTLGWKF